MFALVFLKYWFNLAYAKDPAGIMLSSSNSTEEQQFCWNPEHLGLEPNEAKILPGDYEVQVMKAQELEQLWWKPRARAMWVKPRARAVCCGTCRGCTAFPFCCTCCQPRAFCGRTSGMLWDSSVPPMCATRTGNCGAAWLSNQHLLSTLDSPGSWMRWKEDILLFALKC